MTVSTIGSTAEFVTNGVTTNYPFYFKFLANEDLVVTYIDPLGFSATLTLGTDYTANGAGSDGGGSVVTSAALAGPGQLVVSREMDAFQQTSLRNQGKFLAETHEDVFDKLTMLIQQGFALFGRALKRPFGRDYFFAENRRITNVRDPIDDQDAATKGWAGRFIADLISKIQGPINNSANVLYVYPDGSPRTVQTLSSADDPALGAAGIGRSTVAIRSVFDLQLSNRHASQIYNVRGFYPGSTIGGGLFYWDATLPKTQHNGWRIIDPLVSWSGTPGSLPAYLGAVGGVGTGCFVRVFNGEATPAMAGAPADWNGTTGTDASASFNAIFSDTTVHTVTGDGRTYWFGNFTANQLKFTITRKITLRFRWSNFVARGEASVNDYAASLFFFDDCSCDIGEFTFDDISYTEVIAGRGIQAVTIVSRTKSTSGFTIGPMHVARGQSLLTCAPLGSKNFRSSNIRFRGAVTFGSIYYGINLADNGDDFIGAYSGTNVIRSVYVFGVSDIDVFVKADRTVPASASVLLNQYLGSRPTENIKIKAHFGEINGPILISCDQTTLGAGVFRNIDLDIVYDILGANISSSAPVVRMGCYDSNNLLMTETKTVTTENIRISLKPGPTNAVLSQPIIIYTPSPNHGKWYISEDMPYEPFGISPANAAGVFNSPIFVRGGRIFKSIVGDLTAANAKIRIPAKYFLTRVSNQDINTVIRISARNGVGSATATRIEERAILGHADASGSITLNGTSTVTSLGFGTPAATFVVAVSADFKFIEVSATGYTGGSSSLTLSFSIP